MGGLDDLYQELILDHYKKRRNRGTLDAPSSAVDRNNPLCGDQVHLEVLIDGDRLADLRYTGDGCSISQASASMTRPMRTGWAMRSRWAGSPSFRRGSSVLCFHGWH